MLSRELLQAVAPRARTLNLIWGAFLAATVIYVALIAFVVTRPAAGEAAAGPRLDARLATAALTGLALLAAAGSLVLPRTLLAPGKLARGTISGSGASPTAAETAATPKLAPSERELLKLLPAYQASLIMSWALRESVAVFGVILAILTARSAAVVPFALVALALLALERPRVVAFLEGAKRGS